MLDEYRLMWKIVNSEHLFNLTPLHSKNVQVFFCEFIINFVFTSLPLNLSFIIHWFVELYVVLVWTLNKDPIVTAFSYRPLRTSGMISIFRSEFQEFIVEGLSLVFIGRMVRNLKLTLRNITLTLILWSNIRYLLWIRKWRRGVKIKERGWGESWLVDSRREKYFTRI